jgi:hypothetical protein
MEACDVLREKQIEGSVGEAMTLDLDEFGYIGFFHGLQTLHDISFRFRISL